MSDADIAYNFKVFNFKVNEKDFQHLVFQLALWTGWRVNHQLPAQNAAGRWRTATQGHAGFPDLVLAHPTRGVIFAELKSATGRVSESQRAWLDTLEQAGAEAYVWRPTDWEFIKQRLIKGPDNDRTQ
jgi:hypothetical protein